MKVCYLAGAPGKSMLAVGILDWALQNGYTPEDIAYFEVFRIGVDDSCALRYCKNKNVSHATSSIVYHDTFVRGQIDNATNVLDTIATAFAKAARGKKLIVVDGSGSLHTGHAFNISHTTIAARLGAPLVLVGDTGIAHALDVFSDNHRTITQARVRLCGVVFMGYTVDHRADQYMHYVTQYMRKHHKTLLLLGFVPHIPDDLEIIARTISTHVDCHALINAL